MNRLFLALRAAVFGSGFFLLWWWVAINLHRSYDSSLGIAMPAWLRGVGVVLMIVGGLLVLDCVAMFVMRGQGTPAPFDPPRRFVAVGPYRFVRNPMYVGGFTVLFGFGLYTLSPAILLFTLPWLLAAHLFVVLYEEPHLLATFGQTYERYCRTVRRWLPGRVLAR